MSIWTWLQNLFSNKNVGMAAAPLLVSHYSNDPTSPELMVKVPLPPSPQCLPFTVRGLDRNNTELDSLAGRAANCHVTICEGIHFARRYFNKLPCSWAATGNLYVDPQAGQQLNSYYDRSGLRFFYSPDQEAHKVVYCSNSTDVIAHEWGHAVLDAVRPDLWNVQGFEIWAFHEAFGDCMAVLHAMEHAEIILHALKETDNDLRKSNIISRIAEEFGAAMYHASHVGSPDALRNAVNSFHYVPPENLPHRSTPDELSAEPHSFSRVFLAAWYDFLVGVYEYEHSTGRPPAEAAIVARDVAGAYLFQALPLAAASPKFYNAMALAMLAVDRTNNNKYHSVLNRAFANRSIVPAEVPFMMGMAGNMSWSMLRPQLNGHDQVFTHPNGTFVRTSKVRTVSMEQRGGFTENPLYNLKMEVPTDEYFEFDNSGRMLRHMMVNDDDVNRAVGSCLDFLYKLNYVSQDPETPFEVQDGKLVRTHFICGDGSFINNSSIPGAPEYGKPWKAANNCGCGNCFKPEVKKALQKVKTGCFVRSTTGRVNSIQVGGTKSIRTC